MGLGGLEPPTSRLSSARSNQLSYKPLNHTQLAALRPRQGGLVIREERETKAARPAGMRGLRAECSGPMFQVGQKAEARLPHRSETRAFPLRHILRKEVIQPQVPLRLPCYDFTPVADPTVVVCFPCGLAQRLRVKPTPMV